MRVKSLLKKLNINVLVYNHKICGVEDNSKNVFENFIFIAINGYITDGHNYIDEAIEKGAKTIFYEKDIIKNYREVNYIKVDSTKKILALVAKYFYKNISKKIEVIGVTGTNGKTTISSIIHNYFSYIGKSSLLIGTNGIFFKDYKLDNNNTTPSILTLSKLIDLAVKKRYNYVIIEVSSHAIRELRVYGISFNKIIFSNLSHDHLDFHKTMDDYRNTKGMLVNSIEGIRRNKIILNCDDKHYKFFLGLSKADVISYGIKEYGDVFGFEIDKSKYEQMFFKVCVNKTVYDFKTYFMGLYNVYNILASLTLINVYKYKVESFMNFLEIFNSIPGRMETIKVNGRMFVIDYAHTPDGVENVLNTLKEYDPKKLTCIIGCGGERDQFKRPIIGKITTSIADEVVFTSDNPREEDPLEIVNEIIKGLKETNYHVVLDRKDAINYGVRNSIKGEIVAILGKGNEKTQMINNKVTHFSDKEELNKILDKVVLK